MTRATNRRAAAGRHAAAPLDTAERIVAAATRLFADKGFDGTSIKDISTTAGVNIAAINYHFISKDKLCRHIIEQFAAERLKLACGALQPSGSVADFRARLEVFLRQTIEAVIGQPDIVRLIQQELDKPDSRCSDQFRHAFAKHSETLVRFLEQARKNGILSAEVEPLFAASFLMSAMVQQTRNDRVLRKTSAASLADEVYRNRWIDQMLRIITGGIVAKEP